MLLRQRSPIRNIECIQCSSSWLICACSAASDDCRRRRTLSRSERQQSERRRGAGLGTAPMRQSRTWKVCNGWFVGAARQAGSGPQSVSSRIRCRLRGSAARTVGRSAADDDLTLSAPSGSSSPSTRSGARLLDVPIGAVSATWSSQRDRSERIACLNTPLARANSAALATRRARKRQDRGQPGNPVPAARRTHA